eukprot:2153911-Rhodomonas_salina.3
MHIANLSVALAARKTEASTRCEATVQAAINFLVPDDASLRLRLETLTADVARFNARLESMDDMTAEERIEIQRGLDSSTLQLGQTLEIHDALTTEFSDEQISAYMDTVRATQRDAQSMGAFGAQADREIHRLTGLITTAKSALLAVGWLGSEWVIEPILGPG